MREPIPNRVAQAFLFRFLKHLLAYEDTHDALRSACQFLKLETQYLSAICLPRPLIVSQSPGAAIPTQTSRTQAMDFCPGDRPNGRRSP